MTEEPRENPKFFEHIQRELVDVAWDDPAGEKQTRPNGYDGESDEPLVCKPLAPLAISDIPPRPWAFGKFLMFGTASVIGARDGGGKGYIAVIIALSMITGHPLLGERVWRKGPVAIITYEDDEMEWRRRIAAACLHYGPKHGFDYDQVIGSFHFISRPHGRVCLAANAAMGVIFPDGDSIIKHVVAIGAALLIVDPFNHTHALLDGNSNVLIAKVAAEAMRIAQESTVAVLVLHHLRKGATGDPDDLMGATALRATFRAARILARMLAEQGEKLKLSRKQTWRYSRITGSKENYAPPPEFTTWYKLESVDLNNPDNIYEDGDNVAVATVWTPPSAFEGIPITVIAEIFDALRIPPAPGLRHSPDPRSNEWAGLIIMDKAGKTSDDTNTVVHAWIENEVLIKGDYVSADKNRRKRTCVILNEAKAAEILEHLYFKPENDE
jgi:hypothetical protein